MGLYCFEGFVADVVLDTARIFCGNLFIYSQIDKSKFYSGIKDADLPRFEG